MTQANINVPLFKEILELRDEAARILGYPNHASLKIDNKMAKTETRVNEFLGDLRTRLAAGGKKELDDLRQYKKRDCEERGVSFDGNFYMWDSSLYSRKMKEQEYSLDEVKISQYFPVDSTFAAMLKIFEEIFGFVFVELKEEERARLSPTGKAGDIVWHDEVRLFSVWDDDSNGNGFCGYLYIDLHPRDNKYSHNANFNLEPGFITKDGTRHYPATALVCNFSKASPTKPALLKHHEVVTLFHELGHGIHDLSGRTKYSYFHGTSVVADFVEAPSQMLENWCWTPSVLKNLSKHWETNEQIPDDLVANLVRTRHFGSATFTLNQLLIGIFDMTAHSPLSHNEAKAMNFGKLYNQLRHDINPSKGPEDIGRGMYVLWTAFRLTAGWNQTDLSTGNGAIVMPVSVISLVVTMLDTMAICGPRFSRPTCSTLVSSRTLCMQSRGVSTAKSFWKGAVALMRRNLSRNSWADRQALNSSTKSWALPRRRISAREAMDVWQAAAAANLVGNYHRKYEQDTSTHPLAQVLSSERVARQN